MAGLYRLSPQGLMKNLEKMPRGSQAFFLRLGLFSSVSSNSYWQLWANMIFQQPCYLVFSPSATNALFLRNPMIVIMLLITTLLDLQLFRIRVLLDLDIIQNDSSSSKWTLCYTLPIMKVTAFHYYHWASFSKTSLVDFLLGTSLLLFLIWVI